MKPHVKLYLKANGFTVADFIPCELSTCGIRANDIHHVNARGMGGSKEKDKATNLMALCRAHHLEFGDKKQHKEYLQEEHDKYFSQRQKLLAA